MTSISAGQCDPTLAGVPASVLSVINSGLESTPARPLEPHKERRGERLCPSSPGHGYMYSVPRPLPPVNELPVCLSEGRSSPVGGHRGVKSRAEAEESQLSRH